RNAAIAVGAGLGVFAILGLLGATGVIAFTATSISDMQGWLLLGITVVVFSWLIFGRGWSPLERKRSAAILVLFIAAAMLWASFEQAGSSLSLFADRSTDRHIFGFEFPASWYQFVQPIFVVALAPVFAWIWLAMGRKRVEPAAPAKFTLGLLFAGLAFLILVPAARTTLAGSQVS